MSNEPNQSPAKPSATVDPTFLSESSASEIGPSGLNAQLDSGDLAERSDDYRLLTALEFRVVRPGVPVRRLRLTGSRYTFGSGEGCSIRLDDPSLRPMHAVLLRDAHRILMRAYSVPLDVNGDRRNESELRVGDIIRMGDYRFELLASGNRAGEFFPPSNARSKTSHAHASDSAASPFLRDKLVELSQQWHARHAECETRENRCDEREQELHGRESELWNRAEHLQRREHELRQQESAARQIQATFEATQDELKSLRQREKDFTEILSGKEQELVAKTEQLQQEVAELRQRESDWESRKAEFAARTEEASQQLGQTQQQAQSASDAVQKMREEFADLNEQLADLRSRHSELQRREQEAEQEQNRLAGELQTAQDAAVEANRQSEEVRQHVEAELQAARAELKSARAEIAEIRRESDSVQQRLNEKLRLTREDLQAAREQEAKTRTEAAKTLNELEQARGEIESQRTAAEKRLEHEQREAEEKISQLRQQLTETQQSRAEAEVLAQEELNQLRQEHEQVLGAKSEADDIADGLRDQIRRLEESLHQATQEAADLRDQCEGASASIQQLELLVDQTKEQQQSAQQEAFNAESSQLQQSIADLSAQLEQANAELCDLKAANEALQRELAESSTPDGGSVDDEQWRLLEQELENARSELEAIKNGNEESLARINAEHEDSNHELRAEIEKLQAEIASTREAVNQVHADIDFVENSWIGKIVVDTMQNAEHVEYIVHAELTDELEAIERAQLEELERSGLEGSSDDGELVARTLAEDISLEGEFTAASASVDTSDLELSDHEQGANEVSLAGESHVVAEEPIWRMESEQGDSQHAPVVDWSAVSTEEPGTGDGSFDDDTPVEQTQQWAIEDGADAGSESFTDRPWEQHEEASADQWGDQDDSPSQSIHWLEETPETSVVDSIDDIEQRVEEAIEGFDETPTDSVALNNQEPSLNESIDENAEASSEWNLAVEELDGSDSRSSSDTVSHDDASHEQTPTYSAESQRDAVQPGEEPAAHEESYDPWDSSLFDQQPESPVDDEVVGSTPDGQDEPSAWNSEPAIDTATADEPTVDPLTADGITADGITADGNTADGNAADGNTADDAALDEPAAWSEPTDELATSSWSEPSDSFESTGWSEPDDAPETNAIDDESGHDSPESPTGLAAMLIRDLQEDSSSEDSTDEEPGFGDLSSITPEESDEEDIDKTNLLNWDSDAAGESSFLTTEPADSETETEQEAEESASWNFDSPEPTEAESDERFGSNLEAEEDVSETVIGDGSKTVSLTPEGEPDDESIEAYMSRLLQRVQGHSGEPAESPSATKKTPEVNDSKVEKSSSVDEASDDASREESANELDSHVDDGQTMIGESREATPSEDNQSEDKQIVPRSHAPERDRNISAMRQLANESARSAVSRSIRIQARDTQMKAMVRVGIGFIWLSMACCIGLLVPWSITLRTTIIGAGVVLFGVFCYDGFLLWKEAQRRYELADQGGNLSDEELAEELASDDHPTTTADDSV